MNESNKETGAGLFIEKEKDTMAGYWLSYGIRDFYAERLMKPKGRRRVCDRKRFCLLYCIFCIFIFLLTFVFFYVILNNTGADGIPQCVGIVTWQQEKVTCGPSIWLRKIDWDVQASFEKKNRPCWA